MTQKYLKSVIYASIVILIYQGIANSDLGIISQLTHQNGNNWAGPLTTALLFLGSGLGSLYNKYIGRIPFSVCFLIGSLGYIVYIAMGLVFMKLGFSITAEVIIFVGSFLAGIMCSVFYNTQFNYINTLSKIDNKQIKYFGINLAFSQSSSIFGNLLSSLLIKPLGQFTTVLILQIVTIVDALFFLFVSDPKQSEQNIALQSQNSKKNSVFTQSQPSQNKNSNIQQNKNMNSFPPLKVCAGLAFTGTIISFIYSLLSIIIYRTFQKHMEDEQLNFLTFVLFIFEGIGQFLGGLFMIIYSKKIKDYAKSFMISSSFFMISVLIIFLGSKLQNYYIIGFGIVATGFCDCSSFVSSLSLAGIWKENGITAFNLSQCLVVSTSVMFNVFVPFQISLIWMSAFYIANIIGLQLFRRNPLHRKQLKD